MPPPAPHSSSSPAASPVRRHFVGWDAPLLPNAAAWVLDARAGSSESDLSQTLIVVPGSRAGRLLLGMLVDEAARRHVTLVPPLIVTPGEMIEPLLGVPRARPASPLARELAWIHALAITSDAELEPLVRPSGRDAGAARRQLPAFLERVHADLGGHGLRFADAVQHAEELAGPGEAARWKAASLIGARFVETLESWGLSDEVTSRLARVERAARGESGVEAGGCSHVVLVGVPEIPGLARRAIEIAAARGIAIDAIIHAPESFSDRFDRLGCVDTGAWAACALPIDESQIAFATDQAEQAGRALAWLAQAAPGAPTDDVVIGITEDSLADLISLEIRRVSSVRVRAAAGSSADRAEPSRLLSLAADLIERQTFRDLMAFIRHPRVEEWLRLRVTNDQRHRGPSAWLGPLDAYAESQAPHRLGRLPTPEEADQSEALAFVTGSVRELLAELWPQHDEEAASTIAEASAARATLELLSRLYGHLPASPLDPVQACMAQACVLLADDLREHISLSENASCGGDSEIPSAFLDRLVSHQRSHAIPGPPDSSAIELVGWLELAHDPSPIAVLIGMNDRNVPGTHDHDPILPGSLRRRLGLPTSLDRLARDSYLASTMARSRPHMLFIAPRRDDEGSPLIPSRLLLRCGRDEIPARMHRALGRAGDGPPRAVVAPRSSVAKQSRFPIAPMRDVPPPARMSVTSFKDYLASPYLFYLRHVLRLSEVGSVEPELGPPAFGALLHDALDRFGKSDVRDSADPMIVRASVLDHFRTLARERFGSHPPVAIAIQIEHAEIRLSRWAEVQAARARAGWHIVRTEWRPDPKTLSHADRPTISVSEGSMELRGKVDRIDVHEETGRIAILDYKSSDTSSHPSASHRTREGVWRDLQLPLYRELIRPLGMTGPVTLGYFNIPRDLDKIGVAEAAWTDADLLSADETARGVVSCVLRREFRDIGRMNDEGTLGLIAGLDALSDYRPVDAGEPTT